MVVTPFAVKRRPAATGCPGKRTSEAKAAAAEARGRRRAFI
jgi:hypothetical protein